MDELLEELQQVTSNELERLNKAQLTFHSPHEAYAVLKNYYESTRETLRQTKLFLSDFWENIREDNTAFYAEMLIDMNACATQCAANAILIALMAQKTVDCIDKANTPTGAA